LLTLAGQLSKNEFSVYEVKCYFYVDEKIRTIYGWEEQNDETRRTTFMWMLCLWSKMLPFTGISLGFHHGLPCFGEETMLFWIMFICLYIYSNLLIRYYNMLSDFNKNASHRDRNILKWDLILKFLLRPTQRYNQIWIFFLEYARSVSLD